MPPDKVASITVHIIQVIEQRSAQKSFLWDVKGKLFSKFGDD